MTTVFGWDAFRAVVFEVFLKHPLPWRVEHDWTSEVIASDDVVVAKCRQPEQAEWLVGWAERTAAELEEAQHRADAGDMREAQLRSLHYGDGETPRFIHNDDGVSSFGPRPSHPGDGASYA